MKEKKSYAIGIMLVVLFGALGLLYTRECFSRAEFRNWLLVGIGLGIVFLLAGNARNDGLLAVLSVVWVIVAIALLCRQVSRIKEFNDGTLTPAKTKELTGGQAVLVFCYALSIVLQWAIGWNM